LAGNWDHQRVPSPRAGGGLVTWGAGDSPTTLALHVLRLSDGLARVVAHHVSSLTDSGVTPTSLVYDSGPRGNHNVMLVDLSSGTTRRLSTSGKTLTPRAGAHYAVWAEPPGGNPTEIVVVDLVSERRFPIVQTQPTD